MRKRQEKLKINKYKNYFSKALCPDGTASFLSGWFTG
jgi:hypothetical protein